MLAQIATEVFRADCQLLDQSIAVLRDPEFWDLTLTLEGSEAAAERPYRVTRRENCFAIRAPRGPILRVPRGLRW